MATISVDSARCLTDATTVVANRQVCDGSDGEKSLGILEDRDVDVIVERRLGSREFRVVDWRLDGVGEINGFLGQYYTLTVTVNVDDRSTRRLRFFAKTPPPTSSPQYDFLVRHDTFNKEVLVYSEIVPRMGLGQGGKWLPDYYLSKPNGIIVLEDAKEEGYANPDKYTPFDVDHCVSVIATLSTFHSRSFVLGERLRRTTGQTILDLYGHVLHEVAFVVGDPSTEKYLSSCVKGACTIVDMIDRFKGQRAREIKDWITAWVPRLPHLLKPTDRFGNVMCHRDLWPNNIMFKRDPETGKPIGCYLIDFQFLRYSPPALDFVICLLLSTDRDTRRRYHDRFVRVYYDRMTEELTAEGLRVEDFLPRDEFEESCRAVKGVALAYSVANMQVMLLTKQAVDEYFVGSTDRLEQVVYGDERADLVKSQCRSVKTYQSRITEVIDEIVEYMTSNPTKL